MAIATRIHTGCVRLDGQLFLNTVKTGNRMMIAISILAHKCCQEKKRFFTFKCIFFQYRNYAGKMTLVSANHQAFFQFPDNYVRF